MVKLYKITMYREQYAEVIVAVPDDTLRCEVWSMAAKAQGRILQEQDDFICWEDDEDTVAVVHLEETTEDHFEPTVLTKE